jgi:hypothetical protein
MSQWKRLGAFAGALFSNWKSGLLTVLSLLSTGLTFTPWHVSWRVAAALGGLMFVFASFLVYCKQAESLEAKDWESKTFQNKLATAEQAGRFFEKSLSQERLEKEALSAEVTALRERVKKLSVKPFDEAQLDSVRSRTEALQYFERDLLRFLVLNGDSRADTLHRSATSLAGGFEINTFSRTVVHSGLVRRVEDHLEGYSTFYLNKELREVLKEVLFPRKEQKPPCFVGL